MLAGQSCASRPSEVKRAGPRVFARRIPGPQLTPAMTIIIMRCVPFSTNLLRRLRR